MTNVLPFITVRSIDTSKSVTSTDKKGMINPKSVTPEAIKDFLGNEEKLVYSLEVEALNETVAKTRARRFVRMKNPFEPEIVTIVQVQEMGSDGVMNSYMVQAGVSK